MSSIHIFYLNLIRSFSENSWFISWIFRCRSSCCKYYKTRGTNTRLPSWSFPKCVPSSWSMASILFPGLGGMEIT